MEIYRTVYGRCRENYFHLQFPLHYETYFSSLISSVELLLYGS